MKKVTLKLTALVMLLGGAITVSNAQTTTNSNNAVTTAVPFLRITPDARSGGMGDVGIATTGDANAAFSNIARTPFNTAKGGVSVNYVPWLRDLSINDVYYASVAGYYKISDNQAISASVRYFSLGNIQFTDNAGNDLQTYRPREFAIDLGYSRKLSSKNSLGIAIRYISSDLASGNIGGVNYKKGNTVAGDLHFFHKGTKENGEGFNWGIALSNLGGKISYTSDATQKDYIPANIGIGGAYTKVFDADNKITFAIDVNKLLVPTPPVLTGVTSTDSANILAYRSKGVVSSWGTGISKDFKALNASAGLEYWYKNQFSFRTGYFYENADRGGRKYFTVGAGLKYSTFGLNVAYLFPTGSGNTRSALSNTVRFGLTFDMDK